MKLTVEMIDEIEKLSWLENSPAPHDSDILTELCYYARIGLALEGYKKTLHGPWCQKDCDCEVEKS